MASQSSSVHEADTANVGVPWEAETEHFALQYYNELGRHWINNKMVKQQQVGRRAYVKYTNDSSLSVTVSNTTNYTISGEGSTPPRNDNNDNENETVTMIDCHPC